MTTWSYWKPINTAPKTGSFLVVAKGLLSTSARWDGSGWYSRSLNRYVKSPTHWTDYVEFPWSSERKEENK